MVNNSAPDSGFLPTCEQLRSVQANPATAGAALAGKTVRWQLSGDSPAIAARWSMPSGKPVVAIAYCTQCNWLLRAGWMAQELLQTFPDDIGTLSLIPATGGAFSITVDGDCIWDRARDGGFPDIRILKQRVRDRVAPDRALGHTDKV